MGGKTKTSWKPGQSGNPSGKPPGAVGAYRKLLANRADELIARMVALAESGDVQALRWCCDRLIGPKKPTADAVTVELPAGLALDETATAVLQAVGAGTLTPDEGTAMVGTLRVVAELRDLRALRDEVAALRAQSERS